MFIPYFHDETQPEPDHYILFILSNYETIYITVHSIYKTLKDFPPNIIKQPPTQIKTNAQTASPPKLLYQEFFDDDLAFLQQIANSDTPMSAQLTSLGSDSPSLSPADLPIPQQITTTKCPHLPSGTTVTPQHQKPKNITTKHHHQHALTKQGAFHPSFHPPDESMDVENLIQRHEDNTSTSGTDSQSFSEHQHETPQFTHHHLPSEFIPDDQYAFDLSHSQATRIEVIDALELAKSISNRQYQTIFEYVNAHKNINVEQNISNTLQLRLLNALIRTLKRSMITQNDSHTYLPYAPTMAYGDEQ
jgi:hypothetical protein